MAQNISSSQEIVKPDVYEQQQQPLRKVTGTPGNIRGEPQVGAHCNRPLMLNKSSQTDYNEYENIGIGTISEEQYQKEKMLEEQIEAMKENIRDHTRMLSQLNATSARSAELLDQAQNQINTNIDSSNLYKPNLMTYNELSNCNLLNNYVSVGSSQHSVSSINSRRSTQLSPQIVHSINNTQQVSSSSPESVKYRSIAENANHNNESSNSLLQTSIMQNMNNYDGSNTPVTSIQLLNGTGDEVEGKVSSNLENLKISIGPNKTGIPAKIYENINWTSTSKATRKLLLTIFERKVLATHSVTVKLSPALKGHSKPIKKMLDPRIIADIIFVVTRKCNVTEKEVLNAITAKCADENKMMRKKAAMRL